MGELPEEVVHRYVRKTLGAFRACYDEGLKRMPRLEGRVSVGVVIDAKGATKSAVDNGSEIPDAKVRECVVKAISKITYPAPTSGGGTTTATIPVVLLLPQE